MLNLDKLVMAQMMHLYSPNASKNSVCAVVVAYYPDDAFESRLELMAPQVDVLLVVDNTPDEHADQALRERLGGKNHINIIQNHANRGIAAALNQGLEYALKEGFKWVLTLDQDTRCYPNMIETLLHVSRKCRLKPAVIGGNYYDPRNDATFVPISGDEDFLEQMTVITSGCLVDTVTAVAVGGFREDYFIDQVDHEFCLRVRGRGGKVVICRKPVMDHSVGLTGGAVLPVLGVLPNHSPLRKYYIARNSLVTVIDYWRQEPAWCLRRLIRLILGLGFMVLLEEQRLSKMRAFAWGVVDAFSGHMGPCQRKVNDLSQVTMS